jgi:HSP20 family molecular chaperone IbpA
LSFSFEVPGFRQDESTLHVESGVPSLEGDCKSEEETKARVDISKREEARPRTTPIVVGTPKPLGPRKKK